MVVPFPSLRGDFFGYPDLSVGSMATSIAKPMMLSCGMAYAVVLTKTNPQACVSYLKCGLIVQNAQRNVFVSIRFNKPAIASGIKQTHDAFLNQ
jgi:hypothetical protein